MYSIVKEHYTKKITIDEIIQILRVKSSLIEEWIQYSENRRTPSGWCIENYFFGYIVYYNNKGISRNKKYFFNKLEATAFFIYEELDDILKNS